MEKAYQIGKVLKVNKQNAITGSGLQFEGEAEPLCEHRAEKGTPTRAVVIN